MSCKLIVSSKGKIFTPFIYVYNSFLGKITDDMYLEFTEQDTVNMMEDLLLTAIHSFEFPRVNLEYDLNYFPDLCKCCKHKAEQHAFAIFLDQLTNEQINILATYMVQEWIGQQLASIENTRMKYSGSDFKFTSQANHMQKLLQMKKDYERKGFHLQRLYKRRLKDVNGIYHSTMNKIMEPVAPWPRDSRKMDPHSIEFEVDCECDQFEWGELDEGPIDEGGGDTDDGNTPSGQPHTNQGDKPVTVPIPDPSCPCKPDDPDDDDCHCNELDWEELGG